MHGGAGWPMRARALILFNFLSLPVDLAEALSLIPKRTNKAGKAKSPNNRATHTRA